MKRLILGLAVLAVVAGPARANFDLTGSQHLDVNVSPDVGNLYDSSTADVVEGGDISTANLHNASSLAVSGGSVDRLYARDNSSVKVTGGITGSLFAYQDSSVDITGGKIQGFLHAYPDSSVDITGGELQGPLRAHENSSVTFHGYNFRVTGGLRLEGERVLGTGILIGEWFDDTPWDVHIGYNSSTATVMAIPEPSTLTLAAFGLLGLVAYGRRKRLQNG